MKIRVQNNAASEAIIFFWFVLPIVTLWGYLCRKWSQKIFSNEFVWGGKMAVARCTPVPLPGYVTGYSNWNVSNRHHSLGTYGSLSVLIWLTAPTPAVACLDKCNKSLCVSALYQWSTKVGPPVGLIMLGTLMLYCMQLVKRPTIFSSQSHQKAPHPECMYTSSITWYLCFQDSLALCLRSKVNSESHGVGKCQKTFWVVFEYTILTHVP